MNTIIRIERNLATDARLALLEDNAKNTIIRIESIKKHLIVFKVTNEHSNSKEYNNKN